MTVEKPKPTLSLRPITTGATCAINKSEFLAITCYKAQEKLLARSAVGFGFSSYWLKNILQPITMRRNHNHVITFDSNLNLDTRVFEYPFISSFIGCVAQVKKTMSSKFMMTIMRKVVSKTARKILPASSVAAATSSLSGPLPPLLYAVMTNL